MKRPQSSYKICNMSSYPGASGGKKKKSARLCLPVPLETAPAIPLIGSRHPCVRRSRISLFSPSLISLGVSPRLDPESRAIDPLGN